MSSSARPARGNPVYLLLDVGNTHIHLGMGDSNRVFRRRDFPTRDASSPTFAIALKRWIGRRNIAAICYCSVAPDATAHLLPSLQQIVTAPLLELNPKTIVGLGIDYPRPNTIGRDRLANALAARVHFGAPCLALSFGTATTFDVVNSRGDFVGGAIAAGLSALTRYLHEKTALLPQIQIQRPRSAIGKNTRQAMLAGAVYGYRGLVRDIVQEIRRELRCPRLPVVATGGYAEVFTDQLPEIDWVVPGLALEGLRILVHTRTTNGA